MTSEQFLFWLNGFLEIAQPEVITARQIQIINDHVALVLKKDTPTRIPPSPDISHKINIVPRDLRTGTPVTCYNGGLRPTEAGDIVDGFATGDKTVFQPEVFYLPTHGSC